MASVTLFENQVGDATSTVVGRVRPILGNTKVEKVMLKGHGTWDDTVTVFFQVSDDNVTFQNLTHVQGCVIGWSWSDFAMLVEVLSGTYFRAVINGFGSPAGSLTVKVIGDVIKV